MDSNNSLVKLSGENSWTDTVKDDALQFIRGKELKYYKGIPVVLWVLAGAVALFFHAEIYALFMGAASAMWAVIYAAFSAAILYIMFLVFSNAKIRDSILFLIDWFAGWWQEYWEKKNPMRAIHRTLRNLLADLDVSERLLAELRNQYIQLLKMIKEAKQNKERYMDESAVALENPQLVPKANANFNVDQELLEEDEFNVLDGGNVDSAAFSMSRFSLAQDSDAKVQRLKNQQADMAAQLNELGMVVSAGKARAEEIQIKIKDMIEEFFFNQKTAFVTSSIAKFVKGGRFEDLKRQAGFLQKQIDGYRAETLYARNVLTGVIDSYRAGRAVKDFRTRKDYKEFVKNSTVISEENKVKLLGPGSMVDQIPANQFLSPNSVPVKVQKGGGFDDLV